MPFTIIEICTGYSLTIRTVDFGPIMASAAKLTIASVHDIVELGGLDPEAIVTPGIFVQRIVKVPLRASGASGLRKEAA